MTMQAQATGSRRFGFHRIAVMALAIGALISVAAALVLSDVVELPFTSESQVVSTSASPAMTGQDRMVFLEQNVQLPDGVLAVSAQSIEQIRFLEQNIQLPNGVLAEPAPSAEQIRFLEQNIWEYAEVPATYARVNAERPYLSRHDYTFLEQNIWDVAPAHTTPKPVGIHRDERLNDGLDY
jgi:hypothetical protein